MKCSPATIFIIIFSFFRIESGIAQTDLENSKLKGKVQSIQEMTWEAKLDSGKYKKVKLVESQLTCYNKYGMVTLFNNNCGSDIRHSIEYDWGFGYAQVTTDPANTIKKYDSNGRVIVELNFNCRDSLLDSTVNIYDSSGNLCETKTIDANGGILTRSLYKYNKKGRIIEEVFQEDSVQYLHCTQYNDKDSIDNKTTFRGNKIWNLIENRYNTYNKLVEQRSYSQSELPKKSIYKYDRNHRLIEHLKYDEKDSLRESKLFTYGKIGFKAKETRCEYHYSGIVEKEVIYFDDHGKKVKSKLIGNNYVRSEKYDKDENIVYSIEYPIDAKNDLTSKYIAKYCYDINGNIKKEEHGFFYAKRTNNAKKESKKYFLVTYKKTYEYKYDKMGNLIFKIENGPGVPVLLTEYKIMYY